MGPRIRGSLEEYARRKGMPFSEYRKTHTGFMAALLELNKLAKMNVYDVVEEEAYDESAIAARRDGPDFILDDQSHIHFRSDGYSDASAVGPEFQEILGGSRRLYVPGGRGIIDMTKDTWVRELFFLSDTGITFLNTLSFGEYFGGQDSFSTEECVEVANEVNEQYPGRVMTLGAVEPGSDGYHGQAAPVHRGRPHLLGDGHPRVGLAPVADEALRKLVIPEELMAGYAYPELTDADKELIFGRNMARLYGIDVEAVKAQFKNDKMSQAKAAAR